MRETFALSLPSSVSPRPVEPGRLRPNNRAEFAPLRPPDLREFDPTKQPTEAQRRAAATQSYLEARSVIDTDASKAIIGDSLVKRIKTWIPLVGRDTNSQVENLSGEIEEAYFTPNPDAVNDLLSTPGRIAALATPSLQEREAAHVRRAAYLDEKDIMRIKKHAAKVLGNAAEAQQKRIIDASGLTPEDANRKLANLVLSGKRMLQVELLTEVGSVATGLAVAYIFRDYGDSISPWTAIGIGNAEYYGSLIPVIIQDIRMQHKLGYSQNAAVTAADTALEDAPQAARTSAMVLGEIGVLGTKDLIWNGISIIPSGDLFFLGACTWTVVANGIRVGWAEYEIRKHQKTHVQSQQESVSQEAITPLYQKRGILGMPEPYKEDKIPY